MEVKYLVYKGPKTEGTVTVTKESPLSKFRKLKVYQGMRLEVGREIPEITVKRILDVLSGTFVVETQYLDDLETFKRQFSEIVESYNNQFGNDAISVVPALVIEGLFSVMGDGAMESVLTALKESDEIEMDVPEIKAMVAEIFKLERKKPKKKKAVSKSD
jgi:hypothetical protein